jgi:ATP-dependent helicase YprA (DUF1998 family)
LVYYSNRGGRNAHGYAICLHCGRAEADTDNKGRTAPSPVLVGHKPLRYRKGEDVCPGNDRPFAIKRNVSLGHEITTDVLELQPQHPLRRAGANALVIALREALAQELGIEADEMGFAANKSRNGLGADAVSLFVFDRAAGGAGFATSFEFLMRPVIKRAEYILDCKTPGCETGCAACVLTSDAPEGKDELDRRAALDFVRKHLPFRRISTNRTSSHPMPSCLSRRSMKSIMNSDASPSRVSRFSCRNGMQSRQQWIGDQSSNSCPGR